MSLEPEINDMTGFFLFFFQKHAPLSYGRRVITFPCGDKSGAVTPSRSMTPPFKDTLTQTPVRIIPISEKEENVLILLTRFPGGHSFSSSSNSARYTDWFFVSNFFLFFFSFFLLFFFAGRKASVCEYRALIENATYIV